MPKQNIYIHYIYQEECDSRYSLCKSKPPMQKPIDAAVWTPAQLICIHKLRSNLGQRHRIIETEKLIRIPLRLQLRELRQVLWRVPNISAFIAMSVIQVDLHLAKATSTLEL